MVTGAFAVGFIASILAVHPQVNPGVRADARLGRGAGDLDSAFRSTLDVHPDSQWQGRTKATLDGGELWLGREFVRGLPVAGSRIAVRVRDDGTVHRVTGRALRASTPLPERAPPGATMWWPTEQGLLAARSETRDGVRTWRSIDGRVLARESQDDDVNVPIVGWRENPVTTPELETFDLDVWDDTPLRLENDLFVIGQCAETPNLCEPVVEPTADTPEGFPDTPPPIEDQAAHEDWDEPYAATQAAQYSGRFFEKLDAWGWDPDVWENIDCEWQEVPPEECRLWIHVNVLNRDEDDELVAFDGAFYRSKGQVFMGQGAYADTAYDMQVLVHEIGHHVTRGWGNPEPTEEPIPIPPRLHLDRQSINEGWSDVVASLLGDTDELYVYFRNAGGLYQGPRTRHVGIPFRCPENVVGETHMEGRIWASAFHDTQAAILDAGLGDEDEFPAAGLDAMAQIRHIPTAQQDQFADASEIVVDEVRLSLGDEAGDLAESIFLERGLLECDYLIDVRDEPSVTGEGDPDDDPFDARFLLFKSLGDTESDDTIENHPIPPAVEFVFTPEEGEGALLLRYTPDRWRTTQRDDEPLDQEGLVAAALVREGDDGLHFAQDSETKVWSSDWDSKFTSTVDPDDGEFEHRILIRDLEPGRTYSIALVSQSVVTGGNGFLMDRMRWEILEPLPPEDPPPDDEGGSTGGDSEGGLGADSDTGCACTSRAPEKGTPWGFAFLALVGLSRWERLRRRGESRVPRRPTP